MADIISRLKSFFVDKSILMRFVIINVAVFVFIHLVSLIGVLAGAGLSAAQWLELPPSVGLFAVRPWSIATYMFTHYDFLHILFNMLWLYCFGIVFLDHYSDRQFVATYLLGGIAGAIFYLAANAYASSVISHGLLGASASVLAVAAATVVRAPNYRINLLLIGMVKIKWIAVACVAIALLTTDPRSNIGGNAAHLGGIVAGVAFALTDRYRLRHPHPKKRKAVILKPLDSKQAFNAMSQTEINEELDRLLIKVKQSGYNSLSKKEKDDLNQLSRNLKI